MIEAEFFKTPNYSAYLVRLWQESPRTAWRASAQCASTGEKVYFASLNELCTFLHSKTEASQTADNSLQESSAPSQRAIVLNQEKGELDVTRSTPI